MKPLLAVLVALFPLFVLHAAEPAGPVVVVRDAALLRAALGALQPGTTLKIGPGEFPGGQSVRGVARLPVRDLRVTGQREGGLNFDDGGHTARSTRGVSRPLLEAIELPQAHGRR